MSSASQGYESLHHDVRAVLDEQVHRVSVAEAGTINDTIKRAAFELGRYIVTGVLSNDIAENKLYSAAKVHGLEDKDIYEAIKIGIGDKIHRPAGHHDYLSSPINTDDVVRPDPNPTDQDDFTDFTQFTSYQNNGAAKKNDISDDLLLTPTLPDEIFEHLPKILQKGCEVFTDKRERDVFITSALGILSGCLSTISGSYDGCIVYPNLYVFIVAPAASGKGSMVFARKLVEPIHKKMVRESEEIMMRYNVVMDQYRMKQRNRKQPDQSPVEEPPEQPKFKRLFLSANSSAAALSDNLYQCDGLGIICETEADTLSGALKQDWGNFSDILRKAFHHEWISFSRKQNNVNIEIENPRLSIILTGTPSQVRSLISSAEDGLFSRFGHYAFSVKPFWRDVSPAGRPNLTEHFTTLAKEVEEMVDKVNKQTISFSLSSTQWDSLHKTFSKWIKDISTFEGDEATSTVKRLGLIAFRIAMVLTALRKAEGPLVTETIECNDNDFIIAIGLVEVYLKHAMVVFKTLPRTNLSRLDPAKRKFYDSLPAGREFSRKEAVQVGSTVRLAESTVDKYLRELSPTFLEHVKLNGRYRKT